MNRKLVKCVRLYVDATGGLSLVSPLLLYVQIGSSLKWCSIIYNSLLEITTLSYYLIKFILTCESVISVREASHNTRGDLGTRLWSFSTTSK